MTLIGLDIASHQEGINVPIIAADFVIVKVSGGTWYTNPFWREWADQTLSSGKLLGLYHYAIEGRLGQATAAQEAEFFLSQVSDYIGKFIPILDWEADAVNYPTSYAKEWLDIVAQRTGATPWMYAYASNVNSADFSSIAHYPLWMASYLNKYDGTGWQTDPDQTWGLGAWDHLTAYQYTSTGYIPEYPNRLDLNVFYGTRQDWENMCGGGQKKMGLGNVAAQIHANMCEDPGFGYSWGERYGDPGDPVTWNIEGRDYTVNRGDYDCSSSVCTAWQKALEGTPYEGRLDGATYTGNMRSVFVNSGLFDVWDTSSTSAVRGDVYLNDAEHTAMCQDGGSDGVYGYDALSEFCINEFGEVYGGQRGDQTGGESRIAGFYNRPWNCTLHYNGAADGTVRHDDSQNDKSSWPLQMYTSNGTPAQRFRIIHNDDGTISLQCEANDKFLDVRGAAKKNGTEVWLYDKNDSAAQRWKFVQKEGNYNPPEAAPFEIVSALNKNYVLDVAGGSTELGAKVQLYKRNGSSAQEWYSLDNGDGTWTIINNAIGPKQVLDARNGGR